MRIIFRLTHIIPYIVNVDYVIKDEMWRTACIKWPDVRKCGRILRRNTTYTKGRLIDKVRVFARGGGGGQGSPKLGGFGGDGGDVIVQAHKCSLVDLARRDSRRFIAGRGQHYSSSGSHGRRGADLTIHVPPGTVIMDEYGHEVVDLDTVGSRLTLARGGRGGSHHSPTWSGEPGERVVVNLLLKLIADIGMVGFPNAGKSTLLGALSSTQPKVADYPFTTIRPHLGYVPVRAADSGTQQSTITIADLPGLVEGAHDNVGMGHKFLRHIERTKALLYVVDVNGFQLSHRTPFRDVIETVTLLTEELEHYMEGLSSRPSLLAVNKMDVPGAEEKYNTLIHHLDGGTLPVNFLHVFPLSAKEGTGVNALKEAFPVALRKSEKLSSVNVTDMTDTSDKESHIIHTHSTT